MAGSEATDSHILGEGISPLNVLGPVGERHGENAAPPPPPTPSRKGRGRNFEACFPS